MSTGACMIDAIDRAYARLRDADVEVAEPAALRDLVADAGRLRAWLDARDVAFARRAAALAAGAASVSVTEALSDGGRRSGRAARAAAHRADLCARMPSFEAALAAGEVSAGHVDALVHATRRLDEADKSAVDAWEDELLVSARRTTVAQFATEVRDLVRMLSNDDGTADLERQRLERSARIWVDRATGLHHLHAVLDAVSGSKVGAALQAQLDSLCQREANAGEPMERLRADALVELLCGADVAGGPGGRPEATVSVLIDHRTLVDGLHAASVCETVDGVPLPVSTARRLCCDAEVLPIVLGDDGEPLDCGRSRRTASRAQRRALAARYRTCAHPGCDTPFSWCRIHHVVPWYPRGRTDLANLLPLCDRHHHLVHEGGWHLSMTPDHVLTLRRPDGTTAFHGQTCDRRSRRRPARAAPRRMNARTSPSDDKAA